MVETMPPLLGAGARASCVAGVVLLAVPRRAARLGGRAADARRAAAARWLVGLLLPGANAVVSVAEQDVPSGLAALLIGLRPAVGDPPARRSRGERVPPRDASARVLVGFAGVALLLRPGAQSGDATVLGAARRASAPR